MPLTVDIQSEQLAEFSGFIAWLHLVDKASGFKNELKLTMLQEENDGTIDPIFPSFVGFHPGYLVLKIGEKEEQVNLYENFHSSEIKNTWAIKKILEMVNMSNDVKEKLMSVSLKMCLKRTYLIGKEQNYCWHVSGYEHDETKEEEYRWE